MIVADTRGMDRLARNLRASAPAAYRGARKGLRLAAGPVLTRAQANAGYSSRIPSSGRVVITSGLVVRVVFGGKSAPNAAPIENDGKGFVRHPTFSPRPGVPQKVGWTSVNSHPSFLHSALDAEASRVVGTVLDVVSKAVETSLDAL
jgi:hypothetical protein